MIKLSRKFDGTIIPFDLLKIKGVFLSEEIKNGYAKFPNWLMDLVEKKTISIIDAHFWVVLNNVPPGFKFRRATLINKGYSKWQIDHSINTLSALNLIRETKINLKNVQYEAIDLQKECPETRQTMSGNSTNYVRNPDTNKTIYKNINNGDESPKEMPPPSPLQGVPYIYKLFRPGDRRRELNTAVEEIIGREYCNEFYESLFMAIPEYNRSKLPMTISEEKKAMAIEEAIKFLELKVSKIYMAPPFEGGQGEG